jgi:hypothetical protein
MRGVSIQQPYELRLEVQGEDFTQGQSVPCVLTIKNRSGASAPLETPALLLAVGNLKKVKAKDADAFEVIARAECERGIEVPGGGEASFQHTFPLDVNAVITDKTQSLFLLYGNSERPADLAQLLLTVKAHSHLRAIFDTFTTVFNFVSKGESSKKDGWTCSKMKPPESRRLSLVEELNLSVRFESDALVVKYLFNVKRFDTAMTSVSVKKGKVEVEQTWLAQDYLFGGGFVRQEFVEKMIDAGLSEVASGI